MDNENREDLDRLLQRAEDDQNNIDLNNEIEVSDDKEKIEENTDFGGTFHERDKLTENNIVKEVKD